MNNILTPISLWKDFTVEPTPQAEELSKTVKRGLSFRELRIQGRKTESGRVGIYGVEIRPLNTEELPALLLLAPKECCVDLELAERYAKQGYIVFCMNYRGKDEGDKYYTEYPEDITYANVKTVGRAFYHADEGAKKTAWYEWTAAAKQVVAYLNGLPYVTSVGAMGIREGGDIVWKLMSLGGVACGITVNAAGWLAYRDKSKFSDRNGVLSEEERLFVAGIDSQSYAPFVKCPVLMLVSVTDKYVDADRAYDTYMRINENQFSSIDYSMRFNGEIDDAGVRNSEMFMDKYLKDRQIFLAKSPTILFAEQDEVLTATLRDSELGEEEKRILYFSEDSADESDEREWILAQKGKETEDGVSFSVQPFVGAKNIFCFGRVTYSSGFTASTKIAVKKVEKTYKNSVLHSNILFDSTMQADLVFYAAEAGVQTSDCMIKDVSDIPHNLEGYGKIVGASCLHGLKTYRIAHGRYLPKENAMMHLDVYSQDDCNLVLSFVKEENGEEVVYRDEMEVKGRQKWQSYLAEPNRLHNEQGMALDSFLGCKSFSIFEKDGKRFIVNNFLWI